MHSKDEQIVYVVDDDADVREGLRVLLQSVGLKVVALGSLTPISAAICLFIKPAHTNLMTCCSRSLSASYRNRSDSVCIWSSRRARSRSSATRTASKMSCSRNGLVRNSTAPAFMAFTLIGISP